MTGELIASEGRCGFHRDWKAEPAGVRIFASLRQDKKFLQRLQCGLQVGEVLFASRNKLRKFCDLRYTEGRLHVGRLKVVAHMRVGVLVIVTARQCSQLPLKTLTAGVIYSRLAPTISSPVAEAIDQHFEGGLVGKHRAALAHCDVMGRIKTHCRNITEGPDLLTLVC